VRQNSEPLNPSGIISDVDGFLALLLAHLIGDFPLQTPWVFAWKQRGIWGLFIHVLLHVGVAFVLVQDGRRFWRLWLILGIAHFLVDWFKLHLTFRPAWVGFLLDQAVHVAILSFLAWGQPNLQSALPLPWLYGLLAYALVPFGLMLTWVYASDKPHGEDSRWRWVQDSFVRYSQLSGYVLVVVVIYLFFSLR